MKMLHSLSNEAQALGELKVTEKDDEDTLVNVKNGDALVALGESVRWMPYGELPSNLHSLTDRLAQIDTTRVGPSKTGFAC